MGKGFADIRSELAHTPAARQAVLAMIKGVWRTDSPSESDVNGVIDRIARGVVTLSQERINSTAFLASIASSNTPVPYLNKEGQFNTGIDYKNPNQQAIVYYPKDFPPEVMAQRGEQLKLNIGIIKSIEDAVSNYSVDRGDELASYLTALSNFIHNGQWDFQRIDGRNAHFIPMLAPLDRLFGISMPITNPEFVNYSTRGMAIFMAGAGISLNDSLKIQDTIAHYLSSFNGNPTMAPGYQYLPYRNYIDTINGYNDYNEMRGR